MKQNSACPECGSLVTFPAHFSDARYHCPRCHALLHRRGQRLLYVIMMAATALILLVPLLFLPILNLNVMDMQSEATLMGTLWALYRSDYQMIAILMLFTGVIVPALMMLTLLLLLIPLRRHQRTGWHARLYHLYEHAKEWGMAEVYLLGILVSIIKLQKMASLYFGSGIIFFGLFSLVFYITVVWFNPEDIWDEDAIDA